MGAHSHEEPNLSQAPPAPSQSPLIPASLDRPGDDPIFALHGEAVRRAAAGEDVLNATIGALMEDDGRLSVLPSVSAALRDVDERRAAAYAPIAGEPDFLRCVIEDLFGGTPLADASVAVATPGGTGAVDAAIVNFLDLGQDLLTTSYYWGPYKILAEHNRRGVVTFRMFDSAGRFDLPSFAQGLRRVVAGQGRALVVLNTPCHNPTGYSLDEAEWRGVAEEISDVARGAPIALLVDNAYAKFKEPGTERWIAAVEEVSRHATVLVAWTVSKAFAQYGARVGALVATHPDSEQRQRIRNALSYTCRGTWSNCNHLGMLAITELLTDPEKRARSEAERASMRALLTRRVERFNELARAAGLRYPRYEGGFFVAVFTPDALETASYMREEHGVFVVPLEGAVRVALCATPEARIPRLVEALAAGVAAAGG